MIDASQLQGSDYVHARNVSQKNGQVLVTEFAVSTVYNGVVSGSDHFPNGISAADGWTFELIRRNQVLPDTLSMVDATMGDGSVIRIMGMGSVWTQADSGAPVDISQIVMFSIVVT